MAPPVTFDFSGITTELGSMLNAIAESNRELVKTFIAESNRETVKTIKALLAEERAAPEPTHKELEGEGLRAQIIGTSFSSKIANTVTDDGAENANVLLPIMMPASITATIWDSKSNARVLPTMYIVTSVAYATDTGEPRIHACVIFGDINTANKTQLFCTTTPAPTTTEAFQNLLAISGILIDKFFFKFNKYTDGNRHRVVGGAYFENEKPKEIERDTRDIWWGLASGVPQSVRDNSEEGVSYEPRYPMPDYSNPPPGYIGNGHGDGFFFVGYGDADGPPLNPKASFESERARQEKYKSYGTTASSFNNDASRAKDSKNPSSGPSVNQSSSTSTGYDWSNLTGRRY
ncbi:hypothetical protein LTR62_000942 [Meristemomyces frigidus]|uniref:Uncharacterized protein n=1 Tax=Meristemomyces frigidus TaxID=1508187 RepID=A0AAN7YGM4_9PEZI|nr:hypothetical protein LTR62_000942 [Meristemomyces frigidus]